MIKKRIIPSDELLSKATFHLIFYDSLLKPNWGGVEVQTDREWSYDMERRGERERAYSESANERDEMTLFRRLIHKLSCHHHHDVKRKRDAIISNHHRSECIHLNSPLNACISSCRFDIRFCFLMMFIKSRWWELIQHHHHHLHKNHPHHDDDHLTWHKKGGTSLS